MAVNRTKKRPAPSAKKAAAVRPARSRVQGRPKAARRPAAPEASKQAQPRSLREVTDALHYVQQSFADALLRLPRPEDFEPLVAPLREFARVSPALVEAFRGVIVTTRALIPPTPEPGESASSAIDKGRLDEALGHVDAAREALRQALADLPRDSHYRPVAAQLRELATVSPSLMSWLQELPKLTTPLSASVAALHRAADDLETARDLLTEDVPAAAPTPRPR